MINATVKEKKILYIEFSEEDLEKLGIEEGDQFEVEVSDDRGSLFLKKFEAMDIDLAKFSKGDLIWLLQESNRRQISVGEILNEAMEIFLKNSEHLAD